MEYFSILLACHFVGDFPFQGDWIAQNKGKSWEIMAYHCLIYTSTFILFAKTNWKCGLLLLLSHFVIDNLKARYSFIKSIWVDQLLHLWIVSIIWTRFIS